MKCQIQRWAPLALLTVMGLSQTSLAQEAPQSQDIPPPERVPASPESTPPFLQVAPYVSTIVPIFAGAGAKLIVADHLELGLAYGVAPQGYYQLIGQVAAQVGNNDAYQDVIEAAFQNNSLWLAQFQYDLSSARSGLHIGVSALRLDASGSSDIDTVLQAATGQSYAILKNALILIGRSPVIDMTSTVYMGEIDVGYSWEFSEHLIGTLSLGFGKVLDNSVTLKTGLPEFEATPIGQSLIKSTENELESIINQYGMAPTLGLSLSWIL